MGDAEDGTASNILKQPADDQDDSPLVQYIFAMFKNYTWRKNWRWKITNG